VHGLARKKEATTLYGISMHDAPDYNSEKHLVVHGPVALDAQGLELPEALRWPPADHTVVSIYAELYSCADNILVGTTRP
jgi:hypothetical protein